MWRIVVPIFLTLALTTTIHAKPNTVYKIDPQTQKDQPPTEPPVTFSPAERNLIRAHLIGRQPNVSYSKDKDLFAGFQERTTQGNTLPSDWQAEVAQGQSLDYHLYLQAQNLPISLLCRLPPKPTGTEILRIGNKVVLIHSATRAVLDVFDLSPKR
jgi:hypothetical protein